MGVAPDGLAELSPHQHQSVSLVVALLVEGLRAEVVLRCPEEKRDPFGLVQQAE